MLVRPQHKSLKALPLNLWTRETRHVTHEYIYPWVEQASGKFCSHSSSKMGKWEPYGSLTEVQSNSKTQPRRCWELPNYISRTRNHSPWFWVLPSGPFLFLKGSTCVCSWIVFSAFFLPVEFWRATGLFLVCAASVPFDPSWHCLCWCRSHRNLEGPMWFSLGLTPLAKSYTRKSL